MRAAARYWWIERDPRMPRARPRRRRAHLWSIPAGVGELHRGLLVAGRPRDGAMGPRCQVEGRIADRTGCRSARGRHRARPARSPGARRHREPAGPRRSRRRDDVRDRVSQGARRVRGRGTHRASLDRRRDHLGTVEIALGVVLFLVRDAQASMVRITVGTWGLVAGSLLLVQGFRMLRARRALP